jgi:AraC-like DNA-binding protein
MTVSGDAGLPLVKAARLLRVSPRTLTRRLQEAGTTYRALHDAHRRRRAEALLREASLTAAELAYRLGYGDPANFGRACRRWFRSSPGRLRQLRVRSKATGASFERGQSTSLYKKGEG